MKCKICDSKNIKTIYNAPIRNGALGQYTSMNVEMYQCKECGVIWHDPILNDIKDYYESPEYRESLEGTSDEDDFYRLHDSESMDKFKYTGTTIFRNKTVLDLGCGCGAFLDFVNGVAKEVVAIEPSEIYRKIMERKGFRTFPYAEDALEKYRNAIDVIVSFDVIEHVEDPEKFLYDVFLLLARGGQAIIGTPTDAPLMRKLLGNIYEKKQLFSVQHLWILSEKNIRLMSERIGFLECSFQYFQRYGIGNLCGWLREKDTRSTIQMPLFEGILDNVYKSDIEEKGLADYIVFYGRKE